MAPPEAGHGTYRLLGTPVWIGADETEIFGVIDRLLAPFRLAPGTVAVADECRFRLSNRDPDPGEYCLHRGAAVVGRGSSWAALVDTLLGLLNRVAVNGFTGLAVHAGVVAKAQGVVAFAAPSGAGKSTLTAACLGVGFDLVSDEALCVDFDSHVVLPYPRPVMLSGQAATLLGLGDPAPGLDLTGGVRALLPAELGAKPAEGVLRLGHVLRPVRRPGPATLCPLHRSQAVATLLAMSFNHFRDPTACFALATQLAREVRVWRLDYDDPRAAASLLLEQLGY